MTVQAGSGRTGQMSRAGAQELASGGQDEDVSCDVEAPTVIDVPAVEAEALVCDGREDNEKECADGESRGKPDRDANSFRHHVTLP